MVVLVVLTACAGRPPAARSPTGDASPPPHVLIAEATPESATPPPPAPPVEARSSRSRRTLGWISVAIGSEAALVAIATSFMMLHEKSVRDAHCDASKFCSSEGFDANSSLEALTWWNVGAFGVAAAGLGVGAVLLLTNPRESERTTSIVVAPNGSGAGLGLRGTF
jgi:hypothetical protein